MARAAVGEALRNAHQYLLALHSETENRKARESAREFLKPFIMGSFEPDESGNFFYEFPEPVSVDGENFIKGLMARRRVSEYTNLEIAERLVKLHKLEKRCIKKVTSYELDLDELYAANQEGIISDDEMDSIIETDVSYSLEKIKA